MKSNYKLGDLIRNVDIKNKDLHCNNLKGLSMTKEFRASTSNIVGTDLTKYKIVAYKQFACDFMSAIRVHKMPIAFNTETKEILISPAYAVFEVVDENIILPEYLMMWFRRSEFDRYADFRSDAAIRGGYGWNELCETEIKLPSLDEQKKIVFEYQTVVNRITLKKQINDNLVETANTLFCKFFIANEEKKNWEEGSFSQMLIDTVGGDWGQETPSGNYICEVSCIRGTDIPALNLGSISDAPTRYILEKNFNAKKICSNNMVVEISGGSPIQATGRIALVPEQILSYRGSNIICSNFCRVLKVNKDYLYFFLQNWLYLYRNGVMFNYENSSTGLKNFNFNAFTEEHTILIPPKDLSIKFNTLIEPIYKEIFNVGFEIEHLQSTLEHILPRIMSVGI